MARKKQRKRNNNSDTSNSENANRTTCRTRKRTNKVTKRLRCRSMSETPNMRKRARKSFPYNLRGSSSVMFVSETPCCTSEEDRHRFAKLGLDSALFLSNPKPAKRKQSHISVITISSSDEDIGTVRTAEWVAATDCDAHLCEEESFIARNNGNHPTEIETSDVAGLNNIQDRSSFLEEPTSPEPVFRPLCVSTPEPVPCSSSAAEEEEVKKLSKRLETTFPHVSSLTNPTNIFSNMILPKNLKSPHTALPNEPSSSQNENSQMKSSQKFYFGPFQTSTEIQMNPLGHPLHASSTNSFSSRPMINDFTLSGIEPISGQLPGLYVADGSQSQGAEPNLQRNVWQMPSTSRSPLSDPIYETETNDMKFKDNESESQ